MRRIRTTAVLAGVAGLLVTGCAGSPTTPASAPADVTTPEAAPTRAPSSTSATSTAPSSGPTSTTPPRSSTTASATGGTAGRTATSSRAPGSTSTGGTATGGTATGSAGGSTTEAAPEATMEVPAAPAGLAPPESDVGESGDYGYTVTEYVDFVVENADRVWTQWFEANGYREPYVAVALIGPSDPPFRSDCRDLDGTGTLVVGTDFPNAFYCPLDEMVVDGTERTDEGALILPVMSLRKVWTGDIVGRQSAVAGDFGAAMIVAHEFGHHVQHEWAQQYNALQRQAGQPVVASPNGKWAELIADCFAGVWANSAYHQGLLEQGDFTEGVAAMEAVGDRGVSAMPHGTPVERGLAVQHGYRTGDPAECAERYWKVDPAFPTHTD